MAAAQALNQSPGIFQGLIEGVARRIDDVSNGRFGNWLKDSTGLTPLPAFLSKPSFGVIKALQSTRKPPSLGEMLIETVNYAIEEARERLSALVQGRFIPNTIHDLFEYLKEHSFDLETRFNKSTGEAVNHLVDKKTMAALPAAQVDPSLSHRNVLKLDLLSRLREQIGNDNPSSAYGSWSGLAWTRDSMASKFGYTVEGNQGYFGRVVGVVSDSEQENFKLLDECRTRGIELILPKEHKDGTKLVVGMPILARSKSMKAEEVHRNLDHEVLSAKFGGGMIAHYQQMATRATGPVTAAMTAEKVSREDFNRLFIRQDVDIAPTEAAFGFAAEEQDRDIVIKTNMGGKFIAWDRVTNEQMPTAVNCLPYGEYERFGRDGKLEGFTTVGDEGLVAHFDKNHRLVQDNKTPRFERVQEPQPTQSYGF